MPNSWAEENPNIGANIRRFRLMSGLTQTELAEKAGLTQDTVSAAETSRHAPRPGTMRKLARALDLAVVDFYRGPDSAVFHSEEISEGKGEAPQNPTSKQFAGFSGR
jgi:transcriptional regulator with XRE-family HTH domain